MDQARYADSDGYQTDHARLGPIQGDINPIVNVWRWRDWVVDAFNKDMPFDQFTIEQIAGDLLPGATASQKLATAFHIHTFYNREGGIDLEEDRTKRVIDRVATVANTWLGLTMQCTQCHSHPYDNLAQKDFYRMFAFFNNLDETIIKVPVGTDPGQLMDGPAMQERTSNRRKTYLFIRGNFLTPDKTAGELVPGAPASLPALMPRAGTPDRLDLARWLVGAKNPLTPRVAVNTIWYHLFGEGIVTSLSDFGARASLPSHPELLDWLAGDFVAGGWRRKPVIKQIVMSSVYRQAAAARPDGPGNALLHRQNRFRVDAEIVSDLGLAVSGLLSGKVGGPPVFPPLAPELRLLAQGPYANFKWVDSQNADRYRRALYTFHKRSVGYPNLQVFDWPQADVSRNGRGRSNSPLQALVTLHSPLSDEAAQALARRIQSEKPGALAEQLAHGIRLALARVPTEGEVMVLDQLYRAARARFENDPDTTRANKTVGAFAPAGVAMADAAAWVTVARAILNLDEFITRE